MRYSSSDVVVIGAGAVGAACAYFATQAGLSVQVLDRGAIASGSSSAGEGNLLVSDKEPGPELDLALLSHRLWVGELAEYGPLWEFDAKGALVVASSDTGLAGLRALATAQTALGITVHEADPAVLLDYEPHLSPHILGGAFYPQDAQLQPMLLVAHLLRLARAGGATVHPATPVVGLLRDGPRVIGVRTSHGELHAGAVVNAAGVWAGEVARLAGVTVPVLPRRGFVLVTEPMPVTIRHKVYAAEYVADVASTSDALQTSAVVEGTPAGTVLIGASRERVGFDRRPSIEAMARLACGAQALFPVLADATVMRSYLGFRPYCPDHLPIIGPDPRAPGLWHACGHEGAGIGLSAATGSLVAQSLCGHEPAISLEPFSPDRFPEDP